LQQAISAGSYNVSSSDVADKINPVTFGLSMAIDQILIDIFDETVEALSKFDLEKLTALETADRFARRV